MAFKLLKLLQSIEAESLPLIKTKVERDLMITIGAAQQDGELLSLKQLTLLNIGASATLRRRIEKLVKIGYLEKKMRRNDGRVTLYAIAKPLWKRMMAMEGWLMQNLQQNGKAP